MKRYTCLAFLIAAALVFGWIGPAITCDRSANTATSGSGTGTPAADDRGVAVELAVWNGKSVERWELLIGADGTNAAESWNAAFLELFRFADADEDNSLSMPEAKLLPRPFALRQLQWGKFLSSPNVAPDWDTLDVDKSGAVTLEEVTGYYVNAGLGNALIAYAQPPNTNELTRALCQELGLVCLEGPLADEQAAAWTAERWRQSVDNLLRLDRNNDELISPGELVVGCTYPGLSPTNLLSPATRQSTGAQPQHALPLILLPPHQRQTGWAEQLPKLAGKNINEDSTETIANPVDWRAQDAALSLHVNLAADSETDELRLAINTDSAPQGGDANNVQPGTSLSRYIGPGLVTSFRRDPGELANSWQEARRSYRAQFEEADSAGTGKIDDEALKPFRNLIAARRLVALADRNRDAQLSHKELAAWIALQEKLLAAQCLITLMDYQAGLFEFIDTSADGSLSKLELNAAWNALRQQGAVAEGRLQLERLPHQLRFTISQGLPRTTLAMRPNNGPDWFRAADRNGDGQLSAAEFLGPEPTFERLDTDGDGFVSLTEAEKATGLQQE